MGFTWIALWCCCGELWFRSDTLQPASMEDCSSVLDDGKHRDLHKLFSGGVFKLRRIALERRDSDSRSVGHCRRRAGCCRCCHDRLFPSNETRLASLAWCSHVPRDRGYRAVQSVDLRLDMISPIAQSKPAVNDCSYCVILRLRFRCSRLLFPDRVRHHRWIRHQNVHLATFIFDAQPIRDYTLDLQ